MLTFFQSPLKMGIILVSLLLSVISLVVLLRKKELSLKGKLGFMYAHIFFLVFPFVFYTIFKGCMSVFAGCNKLFPIFILIGLSGGISIVLGLIVAQFLFVKKYKHKSTLVQKAWFVSTINKFAKKFNVKKPLVFVVDMAKPIAFSLSSLKTKIFISVGLLDLLSKKETEAVLLHELSHIKDKSSTLKGSTMLTRYLSPLAMFSHLNEQLVLEEQRADQFAIRAQGTKRFLKSAKKKIDAFHNFEKRFS